MIYFIFIVAETKFPKKEYWNKLEQVLELVNLLIIITDLAK